MLKIFAASPRRHRFPSESYFRSESYYVIQKAGTSKFQPNIISRSQFDRSYDDILEFCWYYGPFPNEEAAQEFVKNKGRRRYHR